MKRAKAKENHVERANMTKKRDIKEEEKEDKQRAKRKKWEREREKNEDNLEIGQYREGRKKKNNDNNGRIERDMLPVSHATVRYPKQIRETCSGREENTKSKRRHLPLLWGPWKKKERARQHRPPNNSCVATQTASQ